jgi:putative colanic acid biosynthesis UDP-glucose lipid carrier transferase
MTPISSGQSAATADSMNDSILGRQSFTHFLVALAQGVMPAIISLANLIAITTWVRGTEFGQLYVALGAVSTALALLLLQPTRLGTSHFGVDRSTLVVSIVTRWIALLGILLAIGYATKYSEEYSRVVIFLWGITTPVLLVISELAFHRLSRSLQLAAGEIRTAVFAGCNEVSLQLAQRIAVADVLRIQVAGFFDDRGADRLGMGDQATLLGRLPEMAAYVKEKGVDMIFVSLPMRHVQRVIDLLDELRDTTASIYYLPDIFVYDLIQSRTGEVLGMPVITMCETPFYGYRGVVKRLTDVTIAATALLLLSPLLLFIALLVKLTSPGPVIFRQRRYGLDGAEITVYKFRSMTVTEDGDNIQQARRNDSRLTPIGGFLRRTSIDELPQLINVLQGRMSLVGPRPHAVAHNEQYRKLIKGYMIRHKVPPGITGWAQVNGCRGETAQLEEMQARVAYDIEYLRHWSVALDLRILWRTFLMLFRRERKAY